MKTLTYIAAAALIVALYLFASTSDWTQEVIYSMTQEQYDSVKAILGDTATDYQIARYWQSHH